MNTLSFTGEMARLQQAAAESHDNIARRSTVLSALNLRTGERVLEVGCGGGYYTYEVARFVGPTGRVCAIDISPVQVLEYLAVLDAGLSQINPGAPAGRAGRRRGDGLEFGGVAFRECAADAA